ncbi:MAG: EamA family transporter [Nanoarchaeota archaeon]|nr:EamA family transporter [Nanoarchaeota archaeon]
MNVFALFMTLFAAIIGSFGAISLKKGAATFNINIKGIFRNPHVILGIFFYGLSILIFILALRYEHVSLLYPLVATAYVWISVLSIWLLKEKMNTWKWLGILFIVIGVSIIGSI